MDTIVLTAVVVAVCVLAVARLLAPSEPGDDVAGRVLRRWAPRLDPTPERIAIVRRHLVRRRAPAVVLLALLYLGPLAYSWTFVGSIEDGSLAHHMIGVLSSLSWFLAPFCVIAGILVAEVIAAGDRPHGPVRVASLRPRRTGHVVPRYGLVLLAVIVGAQVTAAAVALSRLQNPGAPAPADPVALRVRTTDVRDAPPIVWAGLVTVVIVVALVLAAVRLAATRRAAPDEWDDDLDTALRARSARMALGLGLMLAGLLPSTAFEGLRAFANYSDGAYAGSFWADSSGHVGLVCVLAGLVGWILVANPPWPGFRAIAATATGRTS